MLGTILNVAGIVVGGTAGLLRKTPLSPSQESFFKVTLGAFTVFYGLRLTWLSVAGAGSHAFTRLAIAVVALMLGKLAGQVLRLQEASNRLGQMAGTAINAASTVSPPPSEGFKVCAALFCAAPLGIFGAVQDGLSGYFYPLAVKAVMDGLATMGLVSLFGWQVLLSALPVLAVQGTVTLASSLLAPFLQSHQLLEPVNATGGLLVFAVALVILQIKKVALAEYLPSLVFAPLLAWVLR